MKIKGAFRVRTGANRSASSVTTDQNYLNLFALIPPGTQFSFLLARNPYSIHIHKCVQIAKYQSYQFDSLYLFTDRASLVLMFNDSNPRPKGVAQYLNNNTLQHFCTRQMFNGQQ